jgi:NAD(P)-dependent dehydrogenase (short-subunit alcohol dehydrogenase family)
MFNNAGVGGRDADIAEASVDELDRIVAVHLRGTALGMKYAARAMCPRGRGSIVNMGSVAGMIAGLGSHFYGAAKAAVIHLTRTVAAELGEKGVRVNCVCPGLIPTPIYGRSFGLEGEPLERSAAKLDSVFSQVQPLQRAGRPEDVAEAVLWLAGDDSGFVTGHALVVDGGMLCGLPWSRSRKNTRQLQAALTMHRDQE